MIVLSLQKLDFSTRFTRESTLPPVEPTVVVDEETPGMLMARQHACYYATCFALEGQAEGSTIHRHLRMSSDGVIEVIDDIRHPAWRAKAIYREKAA